MTGKRRSSGKVGRCFTTTPAGFAGFGTTLTFGAGETTAAKRHLGEAGTGRPARAHRPHGETQWHG